MNFFDRLFKRKSKAPIPPMPSWETVIEMKMNGHIFVHMIMRYPQCGSHSEGLLENLFLKTQMNCLKN